MEQLSELLIELTREIMGSDWFVSPRTIITRISDTTDECDLYLVKWTDAIKMDEAYLKFTIDHRAGIPVSNQIRYAIGGLRDSKRP